MSPLVVPTPKLTRSAFGNRLSSATPNRLRRNGWAQNAPSRVAMACSALSAAATTDAGGPPVCEGDDADPIAVAAERREHLDAVDPLESGAEVVGERCVVRRDPVESESP